ncbi:MAG: hypothetical protein OSB69_19350 [Alphaproteobacteria bacterium]|nr:hypothetical protein [Alphaproteobacteria bacterium]
MPRRRTNEIDITLGKGSSMKAGLRSALRQRTRLTGLQATVNKINHQLRNMLATATLI